MAILDPRGNSLPPSTASETPRKIVKRRAVAIAGGVAAVALFVGNLEKIRSAIAVWFFPKKRGFVHHGVAAIELVGRSRSALPLAFAAERRYAGCTQARNAMPEWIETLTVDASYDERTRVTGIGVVVQRRSGGSGRGPILEQIAEGHADVASGDGELFAVLRALEIAVQRRFVRIKVRSDYNRMRRLIRQQYRSGLADVGLRGRVLEVAHCFDWVDFGYVPRRKNQLAHRLARQGRLCVPQSTNQDAARDAGLPFLHPGAFRVPTAFNPFLDSSSTDNREA